MILEYEKGEKKHISYAEDQKEILIRDFFMAE